MFKSWGGWAGWAVFFLGFVVVFHQGVSLFVDFDAVKPKGFHRFLASGL